MDLAGAISRILAYKPTPKPARAPSATFVVSVHGPAFETHAATGDMPVGDVLCGAEVSMCGYPKRDGTVTCATCRELSGAQNTDWVADLHDTTPDTLTVEAAANHLAEKLETD